MYKVLTKELLFETNPKIQLATCELLSNLSLSSKIQTLGEEAGDGLGQDLTNVIGILRSEIEAYYAAGESKE